MASISRSRRSRKKADLAVAPALSKLKQSSLLVGLSRYDRKGKNNNENDMLEDSDPVRP